MATTQYQKIILGLKVRQLRQEKGWNFEELSRQTGISVSYLNEIEKGKKYPQPENRRRIDQRPQRERPDAPVAERRQQHAVDAEVQLHGGAARVAVGQAGDEHR